MADYPGGDGSASPLVSALAGGTDAAAAATAVDEGTLPASFPGAGVFEDVLPQVIVTDHATDDFDTGPGIFWFERIHYTPEVIELGNLLSTVTVAAEIYNAYRKTSQTLVSATNNAGAGITFDGLGSPPLELEAQEGAVFDVVVSIDGPPTINGTLDFVTDPAGFSISVTGSRVVMFAFEPETGITETLEWKTDILTAADGTEQRIAQRKNPRQLVDMRVLIPEGDDRRRMMALLKGWHARVFGVPIWWEAQSLQADAASGAGSVSVDTSYADYRVGGLCIVWRDSETFDAVQIDTVNANSLDLSSTLNHDYEAGEALVMPLRTAHLRQDVPIKRFLNSLQEARLSWTVLDNDVGDSFADTSPYGAHNGRVLLDDPNVAGDGIEDGLYVETVDVDNGIGVRTRYSDWIADTVTTQKGFYGGTREAVWQARRLAHALRGSQVSFYLPTFYQDLVPANGLTSAGFTVDIENVGYTDYLLGAEPFVSIWIELVDGTILTRQVTDATVVDEDTETLTVDEAWPADYTADEVARVSLLRLVRIADDRVTFVHDLPGSAQIQANVRGAPV